ncbi:MAG: aminopeptidase P family protein [Clostridia bacterium]|nr:aminopeptidase P family protein [Clostridia bacterium]
MIFNLLKTAGVDAALITSQYTALYFTGYKNPDCCIFVTPDKCYYLTDARYTNEARKAIPSIFEVIDAGKQFAKTVQNLTAAHKVKRLGLELGSLTYANYKQYEELFEGVKFFDICDNIAKIRITKTESELALIQEACNITDRTFSRVLGEIKEGISELELAYRLQLLLVQEGGEGISFDTICVFGENTANPHGHPSSRQLKYGDPITLDFGAIHKGYCADLTRSFSFGKPTEEYIKVYNIVKEANELAIKGLFAGITGAQADGISRKVIEDYGYGSYFLHSLGHGVGVEVHEKPYLAKSSVDILDNNMVFSIEPGIYTGKFGVRIEDLVTIKDSKAVVLSHSDKKLIII